MFDLMPYGFGGRHLHSYNPFRELEEFEKGFWNNNTFGEFKTDIKDLGDAYLLEADLPGFRKEDIQIKLEQGYLTIQGERQSESEEKDEKKIM